MKQIFICSFFLASNLSCDKKEIAEGTEIAEDNPKEQVNDSTLVLSYQTSVTLKHTLNWEYGAQKLWKKFPLLSGSLCYEGWINLPYYENIPTD